MNELEQAQAALTQAQTAHDALPADTAVEVRAAAEQTISDAAANVERLKPAVDAGRTYTRAELQAEIDRVAAKTRNEAREAIRRENEQARLREQGEWKTLHEEAEAKVAELTPFKERAERLSTSVNKGIDSEVKDWPKEVKAMDPGVENIDARLAWLEQARPLAKRLLAAAPADDFGRGNGNGATPEQAKEIMQQSMVSTGRYGG